MKYTLLYIALLCGFSLSAHATPDIAIHDVRIVAVDTETRPTAIFFTIQNKSSNPLSLLGVITSACGRAELHDHIHERNVMRMRQIDRVDLAPGETISFVPTGKHVMCFNPALPMTIGADIPVDFMFLTGVPLKEKSYTRTSMGKIVSIETAHGK